MTLKTKAKKILIGALAALALLVVAAVAPAGSYTCAYNDPITGCCDAWAPGILPQARWCSGDPGPMQVNLYTGANFTGMCETIDVSTSAVMIPDASQWGWYNTTSCNQQTLRVGSVKTGTQGWAAFYPTTNYGKQNLGVGSRCAPANNANTTGLVIKSFALTALPHC